MNIAELQSIFEYELKRKLAQRSRSPQEELRRLISAFKFFDYTSSFILDKNQWINGVLRTGLCGFNISDLAKVFERYDPNKSGYINYINFSNHIYGKEDLIPLASDFENDIYNKKIINSSENNNQFKPPGLYERNFNKEVEENQLSHYNNSESSINDFNLNKYNNATNKLSNNEEPIQKNYHMNKSQSQVIIPRKNNTDSKNINNNNIIQNTSNKDNIIQENINKNTNTDNSENKNYFQKLINIFRNKININNGITFYAFAHALKSLEDKSTNSINIESLSSILEQMEININQDDLINFYSILDYTQSNKVLTNEILRIIKGEIPEKRKILIVSKFALMDKEKTGIIPINLVKQLYNSQFHPDAFLGKKTPEDVYKEFLYTFDIFCEINGLKEEISFKDFIDYYTPISASILNDNYFDDIIYGVWNIEGKNDDDKTNNLKNLNENKIFDNNNYNYNEDNMQIDKMNNFEINNNNLSKSQNIMNSKIRPISSTNNEQYVKKERMTPYYNPRSSPEGKGIKMFRQLRFNPITNEYIMSPMSPDNNRNNIYNDYEENLNTNTNANMNNRLENNYNKNNNININVSNKFELLRNLLAKRGSKSIFIIQRMFYIYDRNQTGEIPFEKLCDIFEIYNINLTKEEIFEFFNILDKEHKGFIKYNDLIHILIDNINQNREILIQQLFERFNTNGFVLLNDLKKYFNPMKHPDVINRIRNKDEVFLDFIDSLEIFREYYGNLNNENIKSGYMSYEDFINFFKEISMSILDDKYFDYLINNCWIYDKYLDDKNNYGNKEQYENSNDNVRVRAGKQIINNY